MNEHTHFFIKIYISHFIFERGDVGCVWEMSWGRWQTAILTSSTSFSSWLGCSTVCHWVAQSPLSAAGSQFSIFPPTDSYLLEPPRATGFIIVSHPPGSAVLLIYTGASLDWRLRRGSIYYTFASFRKISVTEIVLLRTIKQVVCGPHVWDLFIRQQQRVSNSKVSILKETHGSFPFPFTL